jgi:hypothetical protein
VQETLDDAPTLLRARGLLSAHSITKPLGRVKLITRILMGKVGLSRGWVVTHSSPTSGYCHSTHRMCWSGYETQWLSSSSRNSTHGPSMNAQQGTHVC